jgi:hypothetical protein
VIRGKSGTALRRTLVPAFCLHWVDSSTGPMPIRLTNVNHAHQRTTIRERLELRQRQSRIGCQQVVCTPQAIDIRFVFPIQFVHLKHLSFFTEQSNRQKNRGVHPDLIAVSLSAAFCCPSMLGLQRRQIWPKPASYYVSDACQLSVKLSQERKFGQYWRRGRDSNPRYGCPYAAFRVRCDRPLCHLSVGAQAKRPFGGSYVTNDRWGDKHYPDRSV